MVRRRATPLPFRLAAPTLIRSANAPVRLAPFGPSALVSWIRDVVSWSISTEVAVWASPMVAPSASFGPEVYTPVSCT